MDTGQRLGTIGVLTFHRCINYGSYWQARCLVEGLRMRGRDAVLLDHACRDIERTEWRAAMQPLLPRRSSRSDIRTYARKTRRFQSAIADLPLSPQFSLHQPGEMQECDLVIVGSDEVWNFSHPWYGGRGLFFGSDMSAPRVVSYAASFGNYDAEASIDPHWSEQLRRFAAISVRDDNSRRLVESAIGTEPTLVLDPCLQFPPATNSGEETEEPFVAVYGHSFSDTFGATTRHWADRRGLRLLSIGYRNDWAHEQRLDADPFDFARLIASSAAMVTNFFHGCLFALLNAKPFACAVSPYRMNKVRDLTSALGRSGTWCMARMTNIAWRRSWTSRSPTGYPRRSTASAANLIAICSRSLPEAATLAPGDIVASGLCIGCGGCALLDPAGRMGWDRDGQLKPAGPSTWLDHPDPSFAAVCPFSPSAADEDRIAAERFAGVRRNDAMIGRYTAAYAGHVAEADFRMQGSSGGMVSWVAAELMRRGLVGGVAHVVPQTDGKLFGYRISRSEAALREGAKSRYYPIELSAVLREIEAVPGRYAVVGVPCFIKAVNLLRRQRPVLAERIVCTIGLFCGHMKSARMVDSFAWQLGTRPERVNAIDYRLKNPDRPANWYTAQLTLADGSVRQQDWWHLVEGDWGSGFFMNPACNFCDDVTAETADIAMGDAWLEPYSSDGRGTNVVVVRSPLLAGIVAEGIAEGRLRLEPVDGDFVRRTQTAGLRQRREGLAYRLALAKLPVRPRKRVAPSRALPGRRKLIYLMRMAISAWSHRMFRLARALDWPGLYLAWGKAVLVTYHGLAYSHGRLGALVDRMIDPGGKARD